jgi:polysaccharide biosynthesis transport protein
VRVRERQASGTERFIQLQLENTKKRLVEQEQVLSEFKKRYPGELPQHTESNLAMLERLNAQLRLNSENLTRALARRETLLREPVAVFAAGTAGGTGAVLAISPAVRLQQLKQELLELRTRFSDKYPDVVRVKEEIALLLQVLAEPERDGAESPAETKSPGEAESPRSAHERPRTVSPLELQRQEALTGVETEIKILRGEEVGLRVSIAEYRRRVENAPRREQEFQQLSRDYDTTNELYKTLMKRHDEALIAGSMEARQQGEHFRSLEPALPPTDPAGPKRGLLLLGGLVLSLGLSVASVALAEKLDRSFHSLGELRTFSRLPVFGIPRIVTAADQQRHRRRFCLATAGAASLGSLVYWTCQLLARGNEQLLSLLPGSRL